MSYKVGITLFILADANKIAPSQLSRRALLGSSSFLWSASLISIPPAFAEKSPKGFVPVKDQQDGYSFVYPFGWQEVGVEGQDSVFKDIIEPLESVSVSIVPTDKTTVKEYGDLKEVTFTLADKVLTSPTQDVTMVSETERKDDTGRTYYDFEFLVKNPRYTRHALASVTVGNGKFYTLVTGANDKRWGKMGDKIKTIVRSFDVVDRY